MRHRVDVGIFLCGVYYKDTLIPFTKYTWMFTNTFPKDLSLCCGMVITNFGMVILQEYLPFWIARNTLHVV